MDATAASIEGSKKSATSFLTDCTKLPNLCAKTAKDTHPDNFSCPLLIPTVGSLSRGDPNGMNCVSFLSRNNRFVVSSKRLVIWSNESSLPYLEFLSFSAIDVSCEYPRKSLAYQIDTLSLYG